MQVVIKQLKNILVIAAAMGAVGCSSVPDNLVVGEQVNLVNYQQASQNARQVLGEKARWGGVIANIKHKPNHTMLEIVQYELRSNSKPKPGDDSLGRFRVYVDGFLEPKIYQEGRLVTALGEVSEPEKGKIEEQEIYFPVLKHSVIHIWPKEKEVKDNDHWRDPFWPYSSRWYWSRYHYLHPLYMPNPDREKPKRKKKKAVQ